MRRFELKHCVFLGECCSFTKTTRTPAVDQHGNQSNGNRQIEFAYNITIGCVRRSTVWSPGPPTRVDYSRPSNVLLRVSFGLILITADEYDLLVLLFPERRQTASIDPRRVTKALIVVFVFEVALTHPR